MLSANPFRSHDPHGVRPRSVERVSIQAENGERHALDAAIRALAAGKLVAYPTESSYALGCDATNEHAVMLLNAAKDRTPTKEGLPVIVADLQTIAAYARPNLMAWHLAKRFMPGPFALLLDKKQPSALAPSLSRDGIVFRIPNHVFARKLAAEYGKPIVATSANKSGRPPCFEPDEVEGELDGSISVLVDAGPLPSRPPSTIVDVRGPPRIVREGPVTRDQVQRALRQIAINSGVVLAPPRLQTAMA